MPAKKHVWQAPPASLASPVEGGAGMASQPASIATATVAISRFLIGSSFSILPGGGSTDFITHRGDVPPNVEKCEIGIV